MVFDSCQTQEYHERGTALPSQRNWRESALASGIIPPPCLLRNAALLRCWGSWPCCYSLIKWKQPPKWFVGFYRPPRSQVREPRFWTLADRWRARKTDCLQDPPCAFPQQLAQSSSQGGCSKDAVNWLLLCVFNSEYNKMKLRPKLNSTINTKHRNKEFIAPVKMARHWGLGKNVGSGARQHTSQLSHLPGKWPWWSKSVIAIDSQCS